MASKTLYEKLNLSQNASYEDIRTVIRQRRLNLYKISFDGGTRDLMDTLSKAEQILLNPQSRAQYDLEHYGETSVPMVTVAPSPAAVPRMPPQLPSARPPQLPVGMNQPGQANGRPPPLPLAATKCPTCATPIEPGARHCAVCGTEFNNMMFTSPVTAPSDNRGFSSLPGDSSTQTPEMLRKFFQAIGWSYARGTIVTSDQPYHAEEEFVLSNFLLKAGAIILAVYIAYRVLLAELGIFIFIAVVVLFMAVIFGAGIVMMFVRPIIGLVAGLIPKGRGGGRDKKQVMVREVRLRDDALREYNVRFRGELRSGHISVGDTIEIWGHNRGGTIMARWGYNFRTRSQIWVKYR